MSPKPSSSSSKTPTTSPPSSPSQNPRRVSSPPPSPPQNPIKTRNPSVVSVGRREQGYTPYQPSNLRNSSIPEGSPTPSPQDRKTSYYGFSSGDQERDEDGIEEEW